MTAPAAYALEVQNGTVGAQWAETVDMYDLLPGQVLWLSTYYRATRQLGTDTLTLKWEVEYWDTNSVQLASTSTSTVVSATVPWTYQEASNLVPAAAVRARVRITATPSGASHQFDSFVTGVRLSKVQNAADVTFQNAAVGDRNRVRFSLYERGVVGYGNGDTTGGLTDTVSTVQISGINYLKGLGSYTANGQTLALGTDTGSNSFIIPCAAGERLFVSAMLAFGSVFPAVGTWTLAVGWLNASGVEIGLRANIGTGTGPMSATRYGGFCSAPALAVGCFLRFDAANNTGGAVANVDMYLGQPMVCSAGVNQTAWPAFNPGPSGDYGATLGADWGNNLTSRPANLSALGGTEAIKNSLAAIGSNLLVNSEMTIVDLNWSSTYPLGFVEAWHGNNTPLPSVTDARVQLADGSYAIGRTSGGPVASGNVIDGATTDYGSPRFLVPVVPGDTIALSGLVAHQGCSAANIEVQLHDSSFAYCGEWGGSSGSYDIGAAAFTTVSRKAMAPLSEVYVVPPDGDSSLSGTKAARWARVNFRFTSNGTANPRALVAAPFLAKIPTGQTTVPPYSPGPGDRSATYGAYVGPGGNLSGGVDGNLRPYIDFNQAGHTNRALDFIPDGTTWRRTRGTALFNGVPLQLGGGKNAIPNGSFNANASGTPLSTVLSTSYNTPVSDNWNTAGNDAAWQCIYEQSGSGTADVLMRLLPNVSIPASGGTQNLYVQTVAPISVRPGDWFYLNATRNCVNTIALNAGFTLYARCYVAFYYANGTYSGGISYTTDVTGNSYGNTTTGTPAAQVPAGAAYAVVVIQGIIRNNNAAAGPAAASGLPGDIRWSGVQLSFNSSLDTEVIDGATYGRTLASRLSSGNPIIDFSAGYHLNKNLDNVGDGPTYGRPLLTRLSAGNPLIDFAAAYHLNKNLDNVGDGPVYSRVKGAGLSSGQLNRGGLAIPFQGGQNLLLNPLGRLGLKYWTASSTGIFAAQNNGSGFSSRFAANGNTGAQFLDQVFSPTVASNYTLSGFLETGGISGVAIQIIDYTTSTILAEASVQGYFAITAAIPNTTDNYRVRMVWPGAASGAAFWYQLKLEYGSAASPFTDDMATSFIPITHDMTSTASGIDVLFDGNTYAKTVGRSLKSGTAMQLVGGKSAVPNEAFSNNWVGSPLSTVLSPTGYTPVCDNWQITSNDAAFQCIYEQSGSGTADVLMRLLPNVSIAANSTQTVYVATVAPIPVRPGDYYYLDAIRSCANTIALAAGFVLYARAYVAFFYAQGAVISSAQTTDVTGNSYSNTTTGTPVPSQVPAGAAYAQVVVQGIIQNNNSTAGPAATSALPGDIRWSAARMVFSSNLDSETVDGSTYQRMPAANMDSNRRGLIDFSQAHKFVGSVPPSVMSANISYTSTTTSVTVSWGAMTIYRADGSTMSVSAGSNTITGLSASTTYKVYPSIADSGGTTGAVVFQSGGTGTGSPAECYPAAGDAPAAAGMYSRGNIPLGGFQVTTPASGSGGGSSGGGGCMHPSMPVKGVISEELRPGSWVLTPSGRRQISHITRDSCSRWIVVYSGAVEAARVTPDHIFIDARGQQLRARDLKIGTLLASAGDHVEVTGLALDTEEEQFVGITVPEEPHLYYGGPLDLLMHNILPK